MLLLLLAVPWGEARVAVMRYGQYGGLSLMCAGDELIHVESEQLGFSGGRGSQCHPRPPCAVPYTLARWHCRGRSVCTGLPVERRPLHRRTCGSDLTDCLRVKYSCVPRKYSSLPSPPQVEALSILSPTGEKLTDICARQTLTTREGFIASPGFPTLYPPQRDCACMLHSSSNILLQSAFFLLKSSVPCKDWLRIGLEGRGQANRCGYVPDQGPYMSRHISLHFHSDNSAQDMGFWMPFKSECAP